MNRRWVLGAGGAAALTACSKFPTYDGPQVTRIEVHKGARRMFLLNDTTVLKDLDIVLGFTADGPKQFEGDGKTPEGRYFIDRKNPQSSFYLSLGISYPNNADRAFAHAQGKSPGGDIFIHGGSKRFGRRSADWTAGCIAVKDREIRRVYAMVDVGTVIDIYA